MGATSWGTCNDPPVKWGTLTVIDGIAVPDKLWLENYPYPPGAPRTRPPMACGTRPQTLITNGPRNGVRSLAWTITGGKVPGAEFEDDPVSRTSAARMGSPID